MAPLDIANVGANRTSDAWYVIWGNLLCADGAKFQNRLDPQCRRRKMKVGRVHFPPPTSRTDEAI